MMVRPNECSWAMRKERSKNEELLYNIVDIILSKDAKSNYIGELGVQFSCQQGVVTHTPHTHTHTHAHTKSLAGEWPLQ